MRLTKQGFQYLPLGIPGLAARSCTSGLYFDLQKEGVIRSFITGGRGVGMIPWCWLAIIIY